MLLFHSCKRDWFFKSSNPDIAHNDRNTVSFNEEKYYIIAELIRHVEKEKTKCNLNN